MRTRHLIAFAIFVALATTGCGTEPDTPPNVALLPVNNTPERAMQRLILAYEKKRDSEFADLFTGDYRYQFSNATDPDLVARYATGWFKSDEEASAQNLFHGGANQDGEYQPGATSIDINFTSTAPTGDLGQSDTVHFKVLFTRVDGTIVVPTSPDPTSYIIETNMNRFFLVRGDSARALGSTQPADGTHWYIYRWVDETQQPVRALRGDAARFATAANTWGRVKAYYR